MTRRASAGGRPASAVTSSSRGDFALSGLSGAKLLFPRQANGVFAELPPAMIAALREKGWLFYTFIGAGGCRFMCSWDTQPEDVEALAADMLASIDS